MSFIFAAVKKLLAILSAIIVFASCSDKAGGWHSAPELQTAHELMQERPDSALKVLIGFDIADSTSRSVVNEYQILVAEALYKNYCQQTNAHAVIDAAAYYDSVFEKYPENSGLAFETARAHYYRAVGETEKDDIVAACADYLKAVDILETASVEFDSVNSNLTACIYKCVGDLFANECSGKQAIENYQAAIVFSDFLDNNDKFCLLRNIGDVYFNDNEYDSALCYHEKAVRFCRDVSLQIEVSNQIVTTFLERDFENTDEAVAYFYKKNFEYQNKYIKFECAQRLAAIFESIGNDEQSTFYKNYASSNAIREMNRGAKTRELIEFYDNYKHEKQNNLLKKQILVYSSIAAGIAIIVFVLTCIFHRKQKKRLAEEISEKENAAAGVKWMLSVANGRFENARRKITEQQEVIKAKNEEIDDMRRATAARPAEECLSAFRASDVCVTIISRIKELDAKGIKFTELEPLTNYELSELRRVADASLNKFTARITGKYPKLKIDDLNFLCLCLLDIPSSAMPMLLGKSRGTVWNRAKKTASIMDIKPHETILQVLTSMI